MTTELKANVLLVDDRPENLLALETVLADLGHNLISVTSAREALRVLLTDEIALILLDVQMPGVSGFELAELIREREKTQRTPIIFVSATRGDEKYVFEGYSLGAVDYLTKPIEPEILKSKVRFFIESFLQHHQIKRQAVLLEEANSELDRLNGELEARVARRTAQLEAANRELEAEIEIRKKSEMRAVTEHAITRILADAPNFEAAAPLIVQAFCEHLKVDVCCLWLPEADGRRLFCTHYEVCETAGDVSIFIAETRRRHFERGVGLPGHVWEQNEPVWLPNTVRGEKYPRARFAAAAGLHSAVGFPIRFGSEFHGVIEFFTHRALVFDRPKLDMLETIGIEIGQFIERKRVEAERERLLLREKQLREQAEKASRLKDEFLATVSHELRTPLNSILGWGQILLEGHVGDAEREKVLETIFRNARAQAQLIDDLLDTSRLITGNLRLSLTPTAVRPVVEAALEVVRPAAEAKNITLDAQFETDDETITCDPQRLQQMVWNLLTNAVKFTPNEGRVEVRYGKTEKEVEITVSDDGQGIAPDFLPFVFDRFRQADSSSTRKHDGLGLGLAIVRHLAELHGGEARVESEGLGRGAAFTITIPRSRAIAAPEEETVRQNVAPPAEIEREPPQLDGVRVLVVDDDDDTCEMLVYALESWGAEAKTAGSAAAALETLAGWRPEVLLTDINMPGEDGYSFIGRLRSLDDVETARIPAIALTAMVRGEDSERALSAGFQLHLPKPVDIDELGAAIAALNREQKRKGAKKKRKIGRA